MLRNYFLLNLMLLGLAVLLGFKLYESFSSPMNKYVSQKQSQQYKFEIEEIDNTLTKQVPDDIQIIVQKDLFRPSRTEPGPEDLPKPTMVSAPPRLVGITIMGDDARAFFEDTLTRSTKPYRINDFIVGFIVNEIKNDRVILLRGEEKIEVGMTRVKTMASPVKSPSPSTTPSPAPSPTPATMPTLTPMLPQKSDIQAIGPTTLPLLQKQTLSPPAYIPPRTTVLPPPPTLDTQESEQ
ncbi:MAG: hypothetical protein AB1610_11800 [Nitrospirota bacterium]